MGRLWAQQYQKAVRGTPFKVQFYTSKTNPFSIVFDMRALRGPGCP